MIKRIRLRVGVNGWLQYGKHRLGDSGWDLCAEPVYEIFDIPDDAKTVWLTAHERPGVNRAKVGFADYQIEVDGENHFLFQLTRESIEQMLKRHGTFYVSAEYQ